MKNRYLLFTIFGFGVFLLPGCLRKKNTDQKVNPVVINSEENSSENFFIPTENNNIESVDLIENNPEYESIFDDESISNIPSTEGFYTENTLLLSAEPLAINSESNVSKEFLGEVYFDFNVANNIKVGQEQNMNNIISIIKELILNNYGKNIIVTVKGHSCLITLSDEYNLQLSARRAELIANIIKNSINDSIIINTFGCGTSEAKNITNKSEEAQAENRRVEVFININ